MPIKKYNGAKTLRFSPVSRRSHPGAHSCHLSESVYILTHPCWGCCASTVLPNGSQVCKWTPNVILKINLVQWEPPSQTCIWASGVKGPQERWYCAFAMFFTSTLGCIQAYESETCCTQYWKIFVSAAFCQIRECTVVGTASQVSSHNSEKKEKEEPMSWQALVTVFKLQTYLSVWDGGRFWFWRTSMWGGRCSRSQTLEDASWEIAPCWCRLEPLTSPSLTGHQPQASTMN